MEESGGYDDYFINQISELLDGRYGKIDCLWFDGCGRLSVGRAIARRRRGHHRHRSHGCY